MPNPQITDFAFEDPLRNAPDHPHDRSPLLGKVRVKFCLVGLALAAKHDEAGRAEKMTPESMWAPAL